SVRSFRRFRGAFPSLQNGLQRSPKPQSSSSRAVLFLKYISLSNCRRVTDEGLAAVCGARVKLHVLDLSRCDSMTERGLMGLAALSSVHTLALSCYSQLTDAALACIVTLLTQLKTLHLLNCDLITNSSPVQHRCQDVLAGARPVALPSDR
ncbi:receptor-type protein kinase, putative, partial [Bodo saltans]